MEKIKTNSEMNTNYKKKDKKHLKMLPEKVFTARNSLLTDLYEINHIRSVRHFFVAVLLLILMYIFVCDVLVAGRVPYEFRILLIGFAKFNYVFYIWLAMFACTLAIYPIFSLWAKYRIKFQPNSLLIKIYDYSYLAMFLFYFAIFFYKIPPYIKQFNLPIASAAIVLFEQIRFLMKIHSFVRTNASKVLSYKLHSEQVYPVPSFTKYFYYLFIPALLYRDEYPRTKEIRWSFVAINFLEFCGGILVFTFLASNYIVPDFQDFGQKPHDWRSIYQRIFRTIFPASMYFIFLHYSLLHAWLNAWAEITKFSDRLFYSDWWNTTDYNTYYRKWNIVVHDYLHEYIYRDMIEYVVPGNRVIAACTVFLTSALVHEYIISFMLGFFLPALFFQFTFFGIIFNFLKVKNMEFFGNTFLWWSLCTGLGLQFSFYAIEYHARNNCPKINEDLIDFFIPRLLTCNGTKN